MTRKGIIHWLTGWLHSFKGLGSCAHSSKCHLYPVCLSHQSVLVRFANLSTQRKLPNTSGTCCLRLGWWEGLRVYSLPSVFCCSDKTCSLCSLSVLEKDNDFGFVTCTGDVIVLVNSA